MKILILGSDEFIGGALLNKLKDTKNTIFHPTPKSGLDLLILASVKKALKKYQPEIIYNCAAHVGGVHYVSKYAADVIYDNLLMTLNLYKAVSEICPNAKIINPLSNCSYPGDADIHVESDWWQGEVHESVYSYGNAKRTIYVVSYCFKKQYGIKTANLLIPNHFGPGDYIDPQKIHALGGMIIRMLQAKKRKDPIFEIWGTGKPIREWGYIDDIVKALILISSSKYDLTYPVNLAQHKGFSIKESAEIIAKEIGFEGNLVFNTSFPDGAPIKILDDKKFKRYFPNFKFTDHKKAIKATVKYYSQTI